MIFRKTLTEIISLATYWKIVSFIGAMLFFQNIVFMQYEFFILENIFVWFSSFFMFMEHILHHQKWDQKCKEDLNTESNK